MSQRKAQTETPQPADELPVGRIAGLFGIRGEVKCDPTRAGRMLFSAGETLRAELPDGDSRSLSIEGVREHKGRLLLRFAAIDSPEEAETLTGATLYAPRARIELAPNEYLDADLVGCDLYGSGGLAGTVERGKMIPLIEQFIKAVDIPRKRIDVDLPEGLLEE